MNENKDLRFYMNENFVLFFKKNLLNQRFNLQELIQVFDQFVF